MPRILRFIDPVLVGLILALTGLGVTMVYSSAGVHAYDMSGNSLAYVSKQAIYASMGLFAMACATLVPYQKLRRLAYPALGVIIFMLVLVLVPGVGVSMGGAQRWLNLGFAYLQPSELAKFVVILYLAYSLEKKQDRIETFQFGVAPHLVVTGVVLALILLERDFGTTAFLGALMMLLMFVAGARVTHLAAVTAVTVPAGYWIMMAEEYRRARLTAFLDPFASPQGGGYQVIQSWLAMHNGGLLGTGLGAGARKLNSLPAGHTDFIFAVIGEELGFVGVVFTLCLFLGLVLRGVALSLSAPDLFGRLLGSGIALAVGLQALINMMVVTGLLPTKGITLPFISYGGSSILFTLMGVGLLLNVTAQARKNEHDMDNRKVSWRPTRGPGQPEPVAV